MGAQYTFDPGEPDDRRKHRAVDAAATYRRENGRIVTKCPRGLTKGIARVMLNSPDRFEWRDDPGSAHPDSIYVMRDGVLYRAVPTRGGISYHGFPELEANFARLPQKCQRLVRAWAKRLGEADDLEAWLIRTKNWR